MYLDLRRRGTPGDSIAGVKFVIHAGEFDLFV
jgi:hypothetical protein